MSDVMILKTWIEFCVEINTHRRNKGI